jgi:non-heme chloroperoxidase
MQEQTPCRSRPTIEHTIKRLGLGGPPKKNHRRSTSATQRGANPKRPLPGGRPLIGGGSDHWLEGFPEVRCGNPWTARRRWAEHRPPFRATTTHPSRQGESGGVSNRRRFSHATQASAPAIGLAPRRKPQALLGPLENPGVDTTLHLTEAATDRSKLYESMEAGSMGTITTSDGTEIFFKDWGSGPPIVFSHGWPLSADDWDTQLMFFLLEGYRVIAHDRRGHGRSTQTDGGHDMDHYADDLAEVVAHLDLQDAVHVGHSTGGGEVVRYLARHGEERVAKAVLISSVPPLMVQTEANPGGLPKSVFDGFQTSVATGRSQFYRDLASGPFYGFNRPGAKSSEPIIENWWRQGMMGGAKAHYDGIVAFSQTDFTEDLKKISVPVLVMHGDDDQIVPYADSGPLSAELVQNGTLKTYPGFPHGMPTTEAATINADLLAFLQA